MPNLSLERKILNLALILLMICFIMEQLSDSSFYTNYLQGLVIPKINLIINNREGPEEYFIRRDEEGQRNNVRIDNNRNDLNDLANNEETIPQEQANSGNPSGYYKNLNKDYD